MSALTIRIDSKLHRKLRQRAAAAGLSVSELVRPAIEDVASPGGKYVYSGQDEVLAVVLQTCVFVSELANAHSPELAAKAFAESKRTLRERGLIEPEEGRS